MGNRNQRIGITTKPQRTRRYKSFKKRICVVTTVLVIFLACGKSPDQKLQEEAQLLRSWAASIRLTAEQFDRKELPERFARKAFEEAQQEIQSEEETLKKAKDLPQQNVQALLASAQKIHSAAGELLKSIGNNGSGNAQSRADLWNEERQLEKIE